MFVLQDYATAVIFCIITMLCWGSWANTQKLAGRTWRFELFYWDYVIGVVLASLLFALTLGSFGDAGRSFADDLRQASPANLGSAILGGVIFNAANILLVAAIALAGMAVAFPVGIGMALVIGVIVNYIAQPEGQPIMLFGGVALITAAIVLDAMAYRRLPGQGTSRGTLGLVLAILCGILMGFFYRFVAAAMSPEFVEMEPEKLSPYTAMVLFSLGIFASNFVFNTAIMRRPFKGEPVAPAAYLRGTGRDHLWGIVGGMIWAVGMMFSIIAFGVAGPAISYGLGQGATMVAALWGVFVWREFKDAPRGTDRLIALMFAGYIIGLALIIAAGW
ncbi:MAG: multidrug DMT transporter permease [Verrucomicrobiae bacterium]|nr:multidrug DMT transporter permease [Verrucomicrobiae bacterium]